MSQHSVQNRVLPTLQALLRNSASARTLTSLTVSRCDITRAALELNPRVRLEPAASMKLGFGRSREQSVMASSVHCHAYQRLGIFDWHACGIWQCMPCQRWHMFSCEVSSGLQDCRPAAAPACCAPHSRPVRLET